MLYFITFRGNNPICLHCSVSLFLFFVVPSRVGLVTFAASPFMGSSTEIIFDPLICPNGTFSIGHALPWVQHA